MNSIRFSTLILLSIVLLSSGCDTGLAPINEPSGFGGVIRFKNWPPADSVRDLRIVAFETYPTDSAGILLTLLAGRGAVYPADLSSKGSLPKFVDSTPYEFNTKNGINLKVQQYNYIVVAQLYGSNSFTDWRPAGVYTTEPNTFNPSPVRVLLHRIAPNIDIEVDFHNPPPKPW
jgi:hypothetical protein